jgi:hypothetical protein
MNLTNEDFMYLHSTSMQWDESWRAKDGRFDPPVKSYEWRWAYWFDSYSCPSTWKAVLAR